MLDFDLWQVMGYLALRHSQRLWKYMQLCFSLLPSYTSDSVSVQKLWMCGRRGVNMGKPLWLPVPPAALLLQGKQVWHLSEAVNVLARLAARLRASRAR